ncbi:hypothetical protein LU640_29335 [Pseudomonas monteilii]|uniref:hypothetical protein n=1 Tax=Pseudomonas monteilii TaxID=76759 RepID=UPI001E658874|nr:hypothetical protein [Pseudomonas monteilii]MCE1020541.1 hypothetical protein [Pseudomonas monteilii]MCE1037891.1 hypothetical protein [Pseudomonas monteilii]MCE1090719.1 hypothetical protein [Pseudomonas monteilii]
MNRFTKSLRSSVANSDWYVALSTALTLPDVCGRLIDPTLPSSKRYPAWFREWLEPKYTVDLPRGRRIFLSGEDCYALRCSYLHEGGGDITQQKARKALEDFHFIFPPGNGNSIHRNLYNNTLQLQVDKFCLEIADAVDAWAKSVADDADIQGRMASLLKIHIQAPGIVLL